MTVGLCVFKALVFCYDLFSGFLYCMSMENEMTRRETMRGVDREQKVLMPMLCPPMIVKCGHLGSKRHTCYPVSLKLNLNLANSEELSTVKYLQLYVNSNSEHV